MKIMIIYFIVENGFEFLDNDSNAWKTIVRNKFDVVANAC